MTNKEAVEYLQYLRHNVYANSPSDIALVKAIKALKKDADEMQERDFNELTRRLSSSADDDLKIHIDDVTEIVAEWVDYVPVAQICDTERRIKKNENYT